MLQHKFLVNEERSVLCRLDPLGIHLFETLASGCIIALRRIPGINLLVVLVDVVVFLGITVVNQAETVMEAALRLLRIFEFEERVAFLVNEFDFRIRILQDPGHIIRKDMAAWYCRSITSLPFLSIKPYLSFFSTSARPQVNGSMSS